MPWCSFALIGGSPEHCSGHSGSLSPKILIKITLRNKKTKLGDVGHWRITQENHNVSPVKQEKNWIN